MKDILGILCDENNLKIAATERKKVNLEKSVEYNQVESYEKQGWEILRKNKTNVRMFMSKSPDVLFENRVWMIFYNLGFRRINKDRNFKLKYGSYSKQIDIFSMDDDNIFIVECKSSQSENPINARSTLDRKSVV